MATREDVIKSAELAKIPMDEEQIDPYLESLQGILDLAKQMERIDTSSVQPIAHPFGIPQRLRPDEKTEVVHIKDFQQLTKYIEAGLYCVPLVLE